MPSLNVSVSGGLVTSRDPSLLSPGELSKADDVEYRPSDPGLWKLAGRQPFNTVTEPSIVGARYLEFDGGTDLIAIHNGSAYRKATANLTGNFSNLITGLTPGAVSFDSTHFSNQHFLADGVNRNRVVSADGTTAFHGMLANTTSPSLSRDAGISTGFTLDSGATITYWIEERVKSGSSILRRNATLSTFTVTLTGDGSVDKPVITRPTIVNSDATHWALFATATNGVFPIGAELSEVAIATTTIEDTRTGTDPALPGGDSYDTIGISVAGISVVLARNFPPPIASTLDNFEDSIVSNDVSDRSKIWYSWIDDPNSFPTENFIDFQTKETDEVTIIKAMSQHIIVGLRDSIWRINYLPRPEDAEFAREKVKAQVEGAHGCVGPLAGCLFSYGDGLKMAYVSRYGILITDGYSWDVLTDDLEWSSIVDYTTLPQAILINNPSKYRLEFYHNNRCFLLHYHPSQTKEGQTGLRMKITLANRPATAATIANINGRHYAFSGYNGILYLNDAGQSEPVGTKAFSVRTGDIFLVGQGNEAKISAVSVHHSAAEQAYQTATLKVISRREGYDDVTRPKDISLARRESTTSAYMSLGESFQFGLDNSDTDGNFRLDYFTVMFESFGAAGEGE